MEYAPLGSTGLQISRLAFGAGPVAAVMIGDDALAQRELVRSVLDAGINWIDTAAGYGNGRAEQALGAALESLGAHNRCYLATKVRLEKQQLDNIPRAVEASVDESLKRMRVQRVTLLQLHNAITERRGDEPDSITAQDALGPGGVADVFERIRIAGATSWLGITAIGQAKPLLEVINSGRFDTIQVPYNLVNPSAGQDVPASFPEANYGNAIGHAARMGMGVFAIRIYAGGVLAGNPPTDHTLTTKYFPLDLYHRDLARAAQFMELIDDPANLTQVALRYSLSHPNVSSAIIGFSEPRHIAEANEYLEAGPLSESLLSRLRGVPIR